MADKPKRRKVHFNSIEEAIADAEQLAAGEVETSGHYSFGQILDHLARAADAITGKLVPPPVPLPLRLVGKLIRPFMISRPYRPGFKLPAKSQSMLWSQEEVDVETGLKNWKESMARYKQVDPLFPHPVFGKMNRQQHDQAQCRHSELHLSFIHPVKESQ